MKKALAEDTENTYRGEGWRNAASALLGREGRLWCNRIGLFGQVINSPGLPMGARQVLCYWHKQNTQYQQTPRKTSVFQNVYTLCYLETEKTSLKSQMTVIIFALFLKEQPWTESYIVLPIKSFIYTRESTEFKLVLKAIPYMKEAVKFIPENSHPLWVLYRRSSQGQHWRLLWKSSALPTQIELRTGGIHTWKLHEWSSEKGSWFATCKNLDDHRLLCQLPCFLTQSDSLVS